MTNQQSLSIQVHLGNDIINIPQKTNKVKSYFTNQSNVTNITDKHGNFILQSSGFHYSIYNNILDNTPQTFTFNMLMDALIVGIYYFESMVISVKMNDRIVAWVKSLGKYSYTWTELLDKPNYGLELYGKRFWPYFNVDSKE